MRNKKEIRIKIHNGTVEVLTLNIFREKKMLNSYFKTLILSSIIFLCNISTAFSQIASGTYTIGGVSPNYATFSAAVADLNTNGLVGNGPVTFNVRNGTYNEQISINAITNASFKDSIIFKSENNDSTLVILTHTVSGAGDNYTVKLNAADYVTFKLMTIQATGSSWGRAVVLTAGADNDNFQNNVIQGKFGSTSASTDEATVFSSGRTDSIMFINNKIQDGSYGLSITGDVSNKNKSTVISNNQITNGYAYGVYMIYADAPVISNNTITTNSTSNGYRGISASFCYNALRIEKNKISGGQGGYGIILEQFNVGTSGSRGRVANNFVQIGASTYVKTGIYVGGSSEYQDIYHNSVNVTSDVVGSNMTFFKAFYTTSGSNFRIKNNIFANTCTLGGYAIYVASSAAIAECDYNYLFTSTYCKIADTWKSSLGYWNGTDAEDLTAWQTVSGMDAHSLSNINPGFVSPTDLHTNNAYIDNAGTDLSSVITDDIDGSSRPAAPCMGADEYTSTDPAPPSPLSGTYTIGGASPNYTTWNAAMNDLIQGGISGNVTFDVRPGTYSEQVWGKPLFKRSSGTTVTFQSSTGNRTDVVLTHAATGTADNYTVKLNELDYVTFQNMTIQATGSSWGRAVVLTCATDNVNFTNNILQSTTTTGDYETVYASGAENNVVLSNNKIQGGSYGFIFTGLYNGNITNEANSGFSFTGNEFTNNVVCGIRLQFINAPIISSNIFTTNSTNTGYQGIDLTFCSNDLKIEKNKISGAQGGFGINLEGVCQGQAGSRGLIANNFIQIGTSTYTKRGIYIGNANAVSQYIDIYHNSVNITGSQGGKALEVAATGNNFRIKNNIFINSSTTSTGGYTMYIAAGATVSESDNNDLYKSYSGGNLGYWGADKADLTAWKTAANPLETSSVSADPLYTSSTDLHLTASTPTTLQAGTDLTASVPQDIDNEARPATPWMGADERNGAAMPIKLLSFSAMLTEDNKVLLNWKTATEINNDYFTVEKTKDGASYFFVDKIKGAGNSNNTLYYLTTDEQPFEGTSYYRLSQTDFDGTTIYSDLVAAYLKGTTSLSMSIFPNPAQEQLSITLYTAENTHISISIYNILGEKIMEQSQTIPKGFTQLPFDINAFQNGYYMTEIRSDLESKPIQQKFIKY